MRSPQQVRIENRLDHDRTRLLKQISVTAFDRAIYADAAKTLGLTHYQTLHPRWMYQTLAPFWRGDRGLKWLSHRMDFRPLPPPPLPGDAHLPSHFVAVRFYARPTFPVSGETGELARETLKQIAQSTPVVLLNSEIHADDHLDFMPDPLPANVHRLIEVCPHIAETNLAAQIAVLARAEAFVGTYGGLAQLALRFGRPVIGLYQDWHSTSLAHRHLSEALALQSGVPFHVLRVRDVAMIQALLPKITLQMASSHASS